MNKNNKYIFVIIVIAILIIVILGYVPLLGTWSGTYTFDGWKDQDGAYRTGFPSGNPLGVFYVGETIETFKCSFQLTQNLMGYPVTNSRMSLEIKKGTGGSTIFSDTISGGAISVGQTKVFEYDLGIALSDNTWTVGLRYNRQLELYNSAVGWESAGSTTNGVCQILANNPNLVLSSYTLDKTSFLDGDMVTASFSILNNGRASTILKYAFYPDISNHDTWMGSQDTTYAFDETGVTIDIGQTITYTKQFIVHDIDAQYPELNDIHVGLDAWSTSYISQVHDEKTLDLIVVPPPVICWRCLNGVSKSREFPVGTTCGSGDAEYYIFTTEPTDCKQTPGFEILTLITAVGVSFLLLKKRFK
jgi:hypothetical protein